MGQFRERAALQTHISAEEMEGSWEDAGGGAAGPGEARRATRHAGAFERCGVQLVSRQLTTRDGSRHLTADSATAVDAAVSILLRFEISLACKRVCTCDSQRRHYSFSYPHCLTLSLSHPMPLPPTYRPPSLARCRSHSQLAPRSADALSPAASRPPGSEFGVAPALAVPDDGILCEGRGGSGGEAGPLLRRRWRYSSGSGGARAAPGTRSSGRLASKFSLPAGSIEPSWLICASTSSTSFASFSCVLLFLTPIYYWTAAVSYQQW